MSSRFIRTDTATYPVTRNEQYEGSHRGSDLRDGRKKSLTSERIKREVIYRKTMKAGRTMKKRLITVVALSATIDPGARYPPYSQHTFERKIESKMMP